MSKYTMWIDFWQGKLAKDVLGTRLKVVASDREYDLTYKQLDSDTRRNKIKVGVLEEVFTCMSNKAGK